MMHRIFSKGSSGSYSKFSSGRLMAAPPADFSSRITGQVSHTLLSGNRIPGPAFVEQRNTTLFVSPAFDVVVDCLGSFVVYRRDRRDVLPASLSEVRT